MSTDILPNTGNNKCFGNEDDHISPKQPTHRIQKNHPPSNIIDNLDAGMSTRKKEKVDYLQIIGNICFTYLVKPKNVIEALVDAC